MAITVETLDKLERRITLSLAVDVLKNEVDARLKKLARTTKADGFRQGKVPMNIVAQRYGMSVQYEVVNDKLGEAFAQAAQEAQLRVAQDEAMPYQALVESFGELAEQFPSLEVQLTSAAQGEVARKLVERRADLGLLFYHDEIPEALERRVLGRVEMVTVCGVNHPLAQRGGLLLLHRNLLSDGWEDPHRQPRKASHKEQRRIENRTPATGANAAERLSPSALHVSQSKRSAGFPVTG